MIPADPGHRVQSPTHPLIAHAIALEAIAECLSRIRDALSQCLSERTTAAGGGPEPVGPDLDARDWQLRSARAATEAAARTCSRLARGCRVSQDAHRESSARTAPSSVDCEPLHAFHPDLHSGSGERFALNLLRTAEIVDLCGEELRNTVRALGIRFRTDACPVRGLELVAVALRANAHNVIAGR